MTRENLKKLTAILHAYLDGKEIEFYSSDFNEWHTAAMTNIIGIIDNIDSYRIKPEPKYRPFKNAEECWTEMQKHQPFEWIKGKVDGLLYLITAVVSENDIRVDGVFLSLDCIEESYTFADGTPFGVKEEE